MIVVDQGPVGAAVIAAVEAAFLRFDERVNNIRVGAGNRHANAAERALGHAIAFDALPGSAIVGRTVEAVLVAATVERPRSAVAFPHRSKENVGILRIKNDVDAAGAVAQVENFLPGFAAIAGAENAALGVFAVGMAESGDEHDVGICGMDDELADVTRVFQAEVVPGLAAVVGTINTIAEGNVAANAGFAGTDINYVGIGVRDGDAADGGSGLLIEEGIPGNAAIRGSPNAAGDGAKIVSIRLAGHARDSEGAATAAGADEAPFHAAVGLGVDGSGGRRAVHCLGDRRAVDLLSARCRYNQEKEDQRKNARIEVLAGQFHTILRW